MCKLPIIDNPQKKDWKLLLARPQLSPNSLEDSVRTILEGVKKEGDKAVREFSSQFDRVMLDNFLVPEQDFSMSEKKLDYSLKKAIEQAKENIEKYHRHQLIQEPVIEIQPGIRCWRKNSAIEKIGLYIPGGTAPLFSTLLMLGVPAVLAGCKEIIVCTPPQPDGKVHPAILFTANLIGIRKIFRLGGVQAIAAMAYGTETIPQVYKIFGPGNQYVTQAKKMVQLEGIAIDMPAGPSELAILADESAEPSFLAADLLSQAEHGPDSQVLLVTSDRAIAEKVNGELEKQLNNLPRKDIAVMALRQSKIIIIPDQLRSMELLNEYAPEHLILACRDAIVLAGYVVNAGSVFLGNYAPESAGDYASGTNHTLPTNGYAKSYSGLSIDSFVKKISFQELTRDGLSSIKNTVVAMAKAEGLEAHAKAIEIRLPEQF